MYNLYYNYEDKYIISYRLKETLGSTSYVSQTLNRGLMKRKNEEQIFVK